MEAFVLNAPDTWDYGLKKVIAQVGIQGALRVSEMCPLTFEHVTMLPNGTVSVTIKSSKTDLAGRGHSFIITANANPRIGCVTRLRQYWSLFPNRSGRFFRKISAHGKPTCQPVGINTMGKIPRFIASYLKLSNVDAFSGHSFRRTSATLLSEQGVSLVELKQHGRWKSSTVAERYVNNTDVAKKKASNLLQNVSNCELRATSSHTSSTHTFENCNFASCSVNIVYKD